MQNTFLVREGMKTKMHFVEGKKNKMCSLDKERYKRLFFCKGQRNSNFCPTVKQLLKKKDKTKAEKYMKVQKVCGKGILRKEFYV